MKKQGTAKKTTESTPQKEKSSDKPKNNNNGLSAKEKKTGKRSNNNKSQNNRKRIFLDFEKIYSLCKKNGYPTNDKFIASCAGVTAVAVGKWHKNGISEFYLTQLASYFNVDPADLLAVGSSPLHNMDIQQYAKLKSRQFIDENKSIILCLDSFGFIKFEDNKVYATIPPELSQSIPQYDKWINKQLLLSDASMEFLISLLRTNIESTMLSYFRSNLAGIIDIDERMKNTLEKE